MVRLYVVGIVIAAAFIIYALVDCLFADNSRFRALNKPLWAIIIIVLPVVGAILWFLLGKARKNRQPERRSFIAPDDDPDFSGRSASNISDLDRETTDERIRRLEQELSELDDDGKTGAA